MKKGEVSPLAVVIGAVILLIVAGVLIAIFLRQTGQGADVLQGTIGSLQADPDGDGIVNQFDKCPCTFGFDEFSGCDKEPTKEVIEADKTKQNENGTCK